MSTHVALRPTCDTCGERFELRNPPGGWTPEQKFCGTWYDHPEGGCGQRLASVLYPSSVLLEQKGEKR